MIFRLWLAVMIGLLGVMALGIVLAFTVSMAAINMAAGAAFAAALWSILCGLVRLAQ